MIPFNTLLTTCRVALYDKDRRGGDVDLASGHYHLAFMNLCSHKDWKKAYSPFDQFADRAIYRILRKLGDKINILMEEPPSGKYVTVTNQTELEEAIKAGFIFHPTELWEIKNPCAEIPLYEMCNLGPLPYNRVDNLNGSPWAHHVTSDQSRLVIRHIWRYVYPAGMTQPYIEGLPYVPLNKKMIARLSKLPVPRFVNELFYAFYNESRKTAWWPLLRELRSHFANPGSTELFAHFVARCYEDAVGFERFEKSWKTPNVMNLIGLMREDEDFGRMPILADMLEDDGCNNEALLKHLRNPLAEFTLGSWMFRVTGRLTA